MSSVDDKLGTLAAYSSSTPVSTRAVRSSEEPFVIYTYYDYLEVPFGATPARIEAAFLKQLERLDYGSSDTGQDMSGLLAMVHSAYKVLSDPEARHGYDATLAREAAMADAELKATLDQHGSGIGVRLQLAPDSLRDALAAIAA
jgi:DnaJ-class molecular chaperone